MEELGPEGANVARKAGADSARGCCFKRVETVFSVRTSFILGLGLAACALARAGDETPLPMPKPDLTAGASDAQIAAVRTEPDAAPETLTDGVPPVETRGETRIGDSGLPVPRFVSLKSGEVYMREGPSPEHKVEWVYVRRGLPVEVIAESDVWRRIRDADGVTGWVHKGMLDGRRSVLMTPGANVPLLESPAPDAPVIAYAEAGVVAKLKACGGGFCEIEAKSIDAWVSRDRIWGVYQDETVE